MKPNNVGLADFYCNRVFVKMWASMFSSREELATHFARHKADQDRFLGDVDTVIQRLRQGIEAFDRDTTTRKVSITRQETQEVNLKPPPDGFLPVNDYIKLVPRKIVKMCKHTRQIVNGTEGYIIPHTDFASLPEEIRTRIWTLERVIGDRVIKDNVVLEANGDDSDFDLVDVEGQFESILATRAAFRKKCLPV